MSLGRYFIPLHSFIYYVEGWAPGLILPGLEGTDDLGSDVILFTTVR